MSIIEEIKLYVKHGKLPIVQDLDEDYFISYKWQDLIIRLSEYEENKKDLVISGGEESYTLEEVKNAEWKIVGQYDIPTVPFTVGQKVKVREDLEKIIMILYNEKKCMLGKIYQIENVKIENGSYIYLLDGYTFSHDWLLPVLESKRTVDDVLAGLSDEDKEIIMEKLK